MSKCGTYLGSSEYGTHLRKTQIGIPSLSKKVVSAKLTLARKELEYSVCPRERSVWY